MTTVNLFDFQFVDRDNERIAFKDFISKNDGNFLWIKGARGFGKTEFLNYEFEKQKNFELCYIDVKNNKNSAEIISDFIIELQKHCDLDFMSMVKERYKHFYNTTYQKTKRITSELFPEISNIASIILDTGYYVVTVSDESKSTVDIINDYIALIISKKKLFICIDNFSRCDIETARIFFQIIKKFSREVNFKSCIITTSEDLSCELRDVIDHNFPWKKIDINELKKFDYFYQILNPIFMMDDFSDDDLNYLYQKCNGSPKRLSTIISKLLEKNGITIVKEGKSIINKKILFSILQTDHIKFDDDDFSSEEKWIIFSYLCLYEKVPVQLLKDLALYISEKEFIYSAYDERIFNKVLLKLIENKILVYDTNEEISTYHDLDYIELSDIFNNYPIKTLFSQRAYEFLLNHKDLPEWEKLVCHHAYVANLNNWLILNFRYGKKLLSKGLFYDAHKIFCNLDNYYNKLTPIKLLCIATTSYETGNYRLAFQQLELINPESLRFKQLKYIYYFFKGKTYNNIGETERAIECLEDALKEIDEDSREYVQTLNVLHMYCFEVPNRIEQAESIFNKIKDKYIDSYPHEWANTMRGCQNFLDDETSLSILEKADSIIINELEKAYLKTTKGFVFVRIDQMEKAEEQFSEASKTIKKLKIHEYSYAANNLAICYMIKNNFVAAKEILLEALLWNRTSYGELVISTHLMICDLYLNSGNKDHYYYNFLVEFVNKHSISDPIANRKIYMNLAIASAKLGNSIAEKAFFTKAKPYVTHSSSEWRYYKLTDQIEEISISTPKVQYQKVLDFDPWFLIYAHD